MGPTTHKVQIDLHIPSKHLCFPHGGFKARLREDFNPQELLRDGHHLRAFGRKMDGAGDGREMARARNNI